MAKDYSEPLGDFSDDDAMAVALILGGGFLFLNLMGAGQLAGSAPAGTPTFTGTAPAQSVFGDVLTGLVPMSVSANGQGFIQQEEGLTLTAQPDASGYSIGYGHWMATNLYPGGIDQAQADSLFAGDIAAAADAVNGAVSVPLSQNQFDALASLAFEIGATAFAHSTLVSLLNSGDYAGAAAQFPLWDQSGGQTVSALQTRRAQEQSLFMA